MYICIYVHTDMLERLFPLPNKEGPDTHTHTHTDFARRFVSTTPKGYGYDDCFAMGEFQGMFCFWF